KNEVPHYLPDESRESIPQISILYFTAARGCSVKPPRVPIFLAVSSSSLNCPFCCCCFFFFSSSLTAFLAIVFFMSVRRTLAPARYFMLAVISRLENLPPLSPSLSQVRKLLTAV